jgi:glycosyltransferase involved in cell wall biosynthesis
VRIAVTVPWGDRLGGAETMLWSFLRHLDRSRMDPLVVFLQPGPYVSDVQRLGLRTEVLEAGRLREAVKFGRTVSALARVLKRERCDLVLNWSAKTQLYGAAAATLAGMTQRTVWWQHGLPRDGWLDRLASALPARAVGCSSQAAARAQGRIWPGRPTLVVYPGIDPPPTRSPAQVAALRAGLGLPAEAFILGVVGRLQPWKRQDVVVEAIAELRRRGRPVHGLVVGGDAYRLSPEYADSLPRLAAKLGVAGHITFTGQVDEAGPYMELMNVVVNPSRFEPFGIVLVEAMSLGKPVVAFASAGPLEIVQPGLSGLLIQEGGGTSGLVSVVDRLLDDPELCRRLGLGARRRFAERFTARRMTEALMEAMERELSR